jgi:hypothetical protein
MTFDQIHEHIESNDGWCTTCKEVTVNGGVEPDARAYECPACGNNTVYGMEEAAAVMMVVPRSDDDDEDGEFDD